MGSHEAEQVKQQLLNNIESSFPKEKADILKRQIMSMNDEQLEGFLQKSKTSECIFCAIASDKTPSRKIEENDSAVAVLEINPASKGHVLIVSKKHAVVDDLPEDITSFAKKIAQRMQEKLKPLDVELAPQNYGEHGVINLIPIYKEEGINSERYHANEGELNEIFEILKKEEVPGFKEPEKIKKERKPRKKKEKIAWLPKRIP